MRDSRLAFLVMTGLIAGFMLAIGQAFGTAYGSPEMRQEVASLVATVPPVMAGMAGNPVDVDTIGGFITWKYGPFFALLVGLWSILALSGTLAGEAQRGSLDFVAASPFGKRRVALEKLAAHVTVVGLSMAFLALSTWVAGSVFGDPALGDEIAPLSAIGFALWVGLLGLISGALAFALAPVVGRASAAGVAGVVMLLAFVVGNYAPYVPEFGAIANLSWFSWTYDHVPLAAQYDWPSLALVALVAVALLAAGVELFARRDLGVMTGLPVPGLPRLTLGLRGPVGRAFGDQLPLALGWGLGIGVFGFMLAAVSRSFGDDLITEFPAFADIIGTIFPGVDLASRGLVPAARLRGDGPHRGGLLGRHVRQPLGLGRGERTPGDAAHGTAHATGLGRRRRHRRHPRGGPLDRGLRHRHRAGRSVRRERGRHPDGRHRGARPVRGGHGRHRRGHRRAVAHVVGRRAGGRRRHRHVPHQPAGAGAAASRPGCSSWH